MIPTVLSIAGSDPDGGAGIQVDLKTFSALGVYGMTVITSVTAQNTMELKGIHDVPADMIKAQIEVLVNDIKINAVKTGMLRTKEIIEVVAGEIEKQKFPLVVDPVMVTKSGAALIEEDAKNALIDNLFPLAKIVTPNSFEAETISGIRIKTIDDAKHAAKKIAEYGSKAVLIKGGHAFSEKEALDLLYLDDEFKFFKSERINTRTTHGVGCSFSSAIAAELAKGRSIENAVRNAKNFIKKAIRFGFNIGCGFGPVNPMAHLYNKAERYNVIKNLKKAVSMLEDHKEFSALIPETQTNIAMALPFADSIMDVAAIPGRIVRIGKSVKASSYPEFGASSHLAKTVLTANKYDSSIRAGLNIKYSEKILKACKKLGWVVSFYDRRKEPAKIKKTEGMSISWGTEQAIKKAGKVPDVIYHKGDWGKEPMITLLGENAIEVANMAIELTKIINI
ncbi:MAG: bifunctional hydroxymethylpyrimidine kinase/phosphomethylpyrimidine kinase, partial [Nitrososphaerales archaeon]